MAMRRPNRRRSGAAPLSRTKLPPGRVPPSETRPRHCPASAPSDLMKAPRANLTHQSGDSSQRQLARPDLSRTVGPWLPPGRRQQICRGPHRLRKCGPNLWVTFDGGPRLLVLRWLALLAGDPQTNHGLYLVKFWQPVTTGSALAGIGQPRQHSEQNGTTALHLLVRASNVAV